MKKIVALCAVVVLVLGLSLRGQTQPASQWEYAKLEFQGSGADWSSEQTETVMDTLADREKFIAQMSGKNLKGTRINVLNATAAQGWEVIAANIGQSLDQPESFLLKRKR